MTPGDFGPWQTVRLGLRLRGRQGPHFTPPSVAQLAWRGAAPICRIRPQGFWRTRLPTASLRPSPRVELRLRHIAP
mgnify:CR=1 FL=1